VYLVERQGSRGTGTYNLTASFPAARPETMWFTGYSVAAVEEDDLSIGSISIRQRR